LPITKPDLETYSDAETERRAEAVLKRMLATPHKPHTASKGKRKESSELKEVTPNSLPSG